MILSMAEDIRVIILKLADRLHNMRTLGSLSEYKQRRIAQETQDVYAPLAHRLGIGWMKSQLEDLCFQHLMPEVYLDLVTKMAQKRADAVTLELHKAGARPAWVQAISKGDEEPNPTPGNMRQNDADRRVDVYVDGMKEPNS